MTKPMQSCYAEMYPSPTKAGRRRGRRFEARSFDRFPIPTIPGVGGALVGLDQFDPVPKRVSQFRSDESGDPDTVCCFYS